MTDKRMVLVPREATEEMTLAAMEAKVVASIAVDGPIPRMPKHPDKASYSDGFDRGVRWGAQTIGSVEMGPAVNAAVASAPHGGKVSRERWEAAVEAVVRERYAFKGGEHIARAVIAALGLEIEE